MKTDLSNRFPTVMSAFLAKQLPRYMLVLFFLWPICATTLAVSDKHKQAVNLNEHIDFYEDKTNQLTIADITSGKANELFKTTNTGKLLYINSNSSFWFKFSLVNDGTEQLPSFLELPYHVYDSIWLYKINPDKTVTYELMGDHIPYRSRNVESNSFAFSLTSPPGQIVNYYVKIRCREIVKFQFNLYDYKAFYQHTLGTALVVGGVLMIYLAMFLYNCFIMLFTGNRAYAYYIVLVASVFGYALVIDGVGFHYLWPNWPWFQHTGEYILNMVGNPALILFTKSFLKTRNAYPKTNKLLNVMLGIWLVVPTSILLLNLSTGILAPVIGSLTMANMIVVLVVAAIALLQKYRPALFFLTGLSLSLIATIIYNMMFVGYIPLAFSSFYLPQLFIVTDTVLLSIALGENIRRMREELERSHIKISQLKENANKELQKQVKERTLELELANKELEAFSYSVSHDLKAPLRGIKGYARMLQKVSAEKLGKQENEMVGQIVTSADSMTSMIADLLVLSKVAKGELQRTTFNPSELTGSIVEEAVKGKINVPETITKPMSDMSADKNLMQHVYNNLISNAVKYSAKKEHPVIEIGSINRGNQTVFYVKDNGAGFDMQFADKLFQPFQRLHSLGEFEGSGIGLSIVKRIIDRHGGRIWAEAETGKGATFYFTVPDE